MSARAVGTDHVASEEDVPLEGSKDGKARLAVSFRLKRALAVAGRVLFPDGKPAPGVEIYASTQRSGPKGADTTTDADGRFRVGGLSEGPVRVSAVLDAFTDDTRATSVDTTAGIENLEIVLPPARR